MVPRKQANFFTCVRTWKAESYFSNKKNRRAGVEKFLSNGEKIFVTKTLLIDNIQKRPINRSFLYDYERYNTT